MPPHLYKTTAGVQSSLQRNLQLNRISVLAGILEWDQKSKSRDHFEFVVDDKRFLYTYIRKNGCTAFKKFIHATSPFLDDPDTTQADLAFLGKHHRAVDVKNHEDYAATIFVYRDPYERLVSAYTNKFVQQKGYEDIFSNYRKRTWRDPQKATFARFVQSYCRSFKKRDPHVKPQSWHLLPIRYNFVVPLNALHKNMETLIGPELAAKHFLQARNPTPSQNPTSDACNISAKELHADYLTSGAAPHKQDFYCDDLIKFCKDVYASDYDMIAQVNSAQDQN